MIANLEESHGSLEFTFSVFVHQGKEFMSMDGGVEVFRAGRRTALLIESGIDEWGRFGAAIDRCLGEALVLDSPSLSTSTTIVFFWRIAKTPSHP